MKPLNLLDLARSSLAEPQAVPGTGLEVLALREAVGFGLERPVWLLALVGELIIDLPHGDFRVLKVGDSVRLEAGLTVTLTPLEETVLLRTTF